MMTEVSKARIHLLKNGKLKTGVFCVLVIVLIVMNIGLGVWGAGIAGAKTRVGEPDMQGVERFVQEQMEKNRIPGLALGIVQKDQVKYTKGFGNSGNEGKGMSAQTPMGIGSMSKSITALAVMQLVEAGKVELDAPVKQYLPWFQLADADASAKITVRHLLNQTSGIPDNIPQEVQEWLGEPAYGSLEEYVKSFKNVEAIAPAGTQFTYANANYSTLGLLVEKISGKSYGEYVEQNIFQPLGMANSFTDLEEAKKADLAEGHQAWFGVALPTQQAFSKNQLPAGYVMSSVEDMTKFLQAHMNQGSISGSKGKVLSAEGVKAMHTPPSGLSEKSLYGMGWVNGGYKLNGASLIWHNGSVANFTSMMGYSPKSEWGVVVLINTGGLLYMNMNMVEQIAGGVLSRLEGGKVIDPELTVGDLYIWISVFAIVLFAIQLFSLVELPRWQKKFGERVRTGKKRWLAYTELGIYVVFELLLEFGLLVYFGWGGFKMWRLFAVNAPDFAWYLLVILVLTLVTGLIRGWLAWRTIRDVKGSKPVVGKIEPVSV